MELIEKHNSALTNPILLTEFIEKNGGDIFDYFGLLNHSALEKQRNYFDRLSLHLGVINSLDYSISRNEAYLNLLLRTSIRLGERFLFEQLYNILLAKKLVATEIVKAASLFMCNVRTRQDLLNALPLILNHLEESYHSESDSEEDALTCLVNYYALYVKDFFDFSPHEVLVLREIIANVQNEEKFTFLQSDFLTSILEIDFANNPEPFAHIQTALDNYLGRTRSLSFYEKGYLIETETEYAAQIMNMEYSLTNLLRTNNILYTDIKDDRFYNSLGRGINVLDQEEQLLAYMYAYGKMHIAKLNIAIGHLPEIDKKGDVLDWGCGQGLATMVLLNQINCEIINSVTLIEPSQLSLKRAALHVSQQFSELNTINKDFDSLSIEDLGSISENGNYIHLFSNILDVELFSITHLIQLIKTKFKGTNYFVISSPYITSLKTARIDLFISAFREEFKVDIYYSSEKRRGEWRNNWTKVIRVLKVEIT